MTLNKNRIRAICFDIDGTLRNTDDQYVLYIEKWLHYIRFFFANQDTAIAARRLVMALEEPGNRIIQIPDRLGIDNKITQFTDFLDRWLFNKTHGNEMIIPGAIDCLSFCQKRFPIGIISARGEKQSLRFLNFFELTPLFNCIATGQTTPHTKPFPDPILWSARQMGVSANECLMVGDTTIEILPAKTAGAQSLGVLSGCGEEDELRRAGADLIIPSVADMMDLFL